MNKKLVIFLGLFLIIALGWYTKKVLSQAGKSDSNSQLIDFAIQDTNSIDKIIITESDSKKLEIIRKNGSWETAKGICINQESIHFILEAIEKISFKGYLSEKAIKK